MSEQWQTLEELWEQAGEKPFTAINDNLDKFFYVAGRCPNKEFIGWDKYGKPDSWIGDSKYWRLAPKEPLRETVKCQLSYLPGEGTRLHGLNKENSDKLRKFDGKFVTMEITEGWDGK